MQSGGEGGGGEGGGERERVGWLSEGRSGLISNDIYFDVWSLAASVREMQERWWEVWKVRGKCLKGREIKVLTVGKDASWKYMICMQRTVCCTISF